jgi:micrococcal nuclease
MNRNRKKQTDSPFYYLLQDKGPLKVKPTNRKKILRSFISIIVLLIVFVAALSRIGIGILRGFKGNSAKVSTPVKVSTLPSEKFLPELISKPAFTTATVVRIVEGDTLKINYNGQEESIRFIGIDIPESWSNSKAMRDAERSKEDIKTIIAMGKQATTFTKSLVKSGDTVRIEFDVQTKDRYGRLLGYVYLPDGSMLNEQIVKAGYANLMTYPPNVKYEERFLKAFREARENRRGLWK